MLPLQQFFSRRLKRNPRLYDRCRKIYRSYVYASPMHQFLSEALKNKPKVRFLQIGANDGLDNDPIRELIIWNPAWTGTFVEPFPKAMADCKANYSAYNLPERFQFVQAAVSDTPGTLRLWTIKESRLAHFPDHVSQLASVDVDHLVKHLPGLSIENDLEPVDLPCHSFESLLKLSGFEALELLVMDVEGHEEPILNSILAADTRPEILLFEVIHFAPAAWETMQARLIAGGYQLTNFGHDCVAVLAVK